MGNECPCRSCPIWVDEEHANGCPFGSCEDYDNWWINYGKEQNNVR